MHNVSALCVQDFINIALILLTSIASCHFNRYVESVLFTWNSSQWFRWTNFEQRYLNNRLFKTMIWFEDQNLSFYLISKPVKREACGKNFLILSDYNLLKPALIQHVMYDTDYIIVFSLTHAEFFTFFSNFANMHHSECMLYPVFKLRICTHIWTIKNFDCLDCNFLCSWRPMELQWEKTNS